MLLVFSRPTKMQSMLSMNALDKSSSTNTVRAKTSQNIHIFVFELRYLWTELSHKKATYIFGILNESRFMFKYSEV